MIVFGCISAALPSFGECVDKSPEDSPSAAQSTVHSFTKIQLTDQFWTEGVAIGDLDRDGHRDIVAWPYWYAGPYFKQRHEIASATQTFKRKMADGGEVTMPGYEGALGSRNAYSIVNFVSVHDFNHDGWPDVLALYRPIGQHGEVWWYENPGESARLGKKPWTRHAVFDSLACENPEFADVFGAGQPGVLCAYRNVIGYVQPGDDPRSRWHLAMATPPVSHLQERCDRLARLDKDGLRRPCIANHGLGYGDIDGDGRSEVMDSEGWWARAATHDANAQWVFHRWPFLPQRPRIDERSGSLQGTGGFWQAVARTYEWPFALSGAQIYVYDVNGDELPDVISSLDAHRYGLAWFEQRRDGQAAADPAFTPHLLMEGAACTNPYGVRFSQLHALALADLDGDGLKDIVTGKRFWAHGRDGGGIDPDSNDPAVLYWFRLVRTGDGSVEFIPYLIDSDSGVGYQIAVGDLNGDGLPDLATANKKGAFVFLQETRQASRDEWARAQPARPCP